MPDLQKNLPNKTIFQNGHFKSLEKLVKSLHLKKYRKQEQLFFVEGEKAVAELLQSYYEILIIFTTKEFLQKNIIDTDINVEIVNDSDLEDIGTFQSNHTCLAVAKQKQPDFSTLYPTKNIVPVLDNIQDPGNLGTIIRICDWYGINKVVCSNDTVDFYNPKVINSSKGSFLRVECLYTDLEIFLEKSKSLNTEIYAMTLKGEDIYKTSLNFHSIIIVGNEANGINDEILKYVDREITIPRFGKAESLNAAVATAVVFDNFFRKNY
ncbi:MAG: RNA methyltransferase [Chloroflexia bacterium]|nr:RNA methyltransferase [Chloroflexia bacterium]